MQTFFGYSNISFFDYWSIIHFFSGLIVGSVFIYLKKKLKYLQKTKIYFAFGFCVLILWELIEVVLRIFKHENANGIIKAYMSSESYLNIFSDIIIGAIGLLIIYSLFNGKNIEKNNIDEHNT